MRAPLPGVLSAPSSVPAGSDAQHGLQQSCAQCHASVTFALRHRRPWMPTLRPSGFSRPGSLAQVRGAPRTAEIQCLQPLQPLQPQPRLSTGYGLRRSNLDLTAGFIRVAQPVVASLDVASLSTRPSNWHRAQPFGRAACMAAAEELDLPGS